MEMLKEEDLKNKPGGRLDMSHGFLHHIRRNQIARDDYDREVKQKGLKQRRLHTTTPRKPRRPDRQVYHPKARDGSRAEEADDCSDSSGEELHAEEEELHVEGEELTELFWLDYEADCGRVTSVLVHKEDSPEQVVKLVEQNNLLDVFMRDALKTRVQTEKDERLRPKTRDPRLRPKTRD